ncbi:80_t:CDS:1 [Funneliformis caledonium]|uniref:80_t:CDS:1 n=1 Tax=Funneliformis caledonium TaxID=1117310 RepID=A0A9N9IFN7_9GLOM|nr:80_t:CDS:1 [Funneliformis caledonium]
MKFWQSIEEIYPELSVFAQRLFAIIPNAAVSERIWSVLSNIHTAKRNRLTAERSGKLAKISWHLKQERLKQEQNEKIIEFQEIIVQERIELDEYNFSDDIELNDIAEEILKETNDLLGKVQDVDNDNEEFIDILTISEIFNVKKFEESGRNINLL